jgi:thiopeptide-type bacteriocin biosynthesis protein
LEAPGAASDPVALEAALARDRACLRERLQAVVTRPEIREALFVASPSLDESFDVWLREPASDRGRKVERSLVKYFSRMSARPTPFGLFAGCSVGRIDEQTHLELAARVHYGRHARLDMDYLFALVETLCADPTIRKRLLYRPNTSLYCAAGRLRYAEARLTGKVRSYHLVAADPSDYLLATLARATAGATIETLAAALLQADAEVTLEEAEAFVHELIDAQVLVPNLGITVSGPEPAPGLAERLRSIAEAVPVAQALAAANRSLEEIDQAGLGVPAERYRDIAAQLAKLPTPVELPRLFQVDMVKPVQQATLGHAVVSEIARGVELLWGMTRTRGGDPLTRFREAFAQRYEARAMPLVEVLDEESGIGFDASNALSSDASPLLDGLIFPLAAAEETVPVSPRTALLARKLEQAQRTGAREITLSEDELRGPSGGEPSPLPDAFSVMATLVAETQEALARGDFRVVLDSATGPSGARLLGRFCHGDETLAGLVRDHLRAEEALRPDAVLAEIVHLPEGRLGNILLRPSLREYEIPFLGRSEMPPERQIPLTDLLVSVDGGRVVLRSARLGREVIPRLTSAHNFGGRNLGMYRFLCTLQSQGVVGGLGWSWGPHASLSFLPRVVTGRLVLQCAQWRPSSEQLARLGEAKGASRFARVQELRAELRLPRVVMVQAGDNELPIDLDNTLCVETFVHMVKRRTGVVLAELYPGPGELCAEGPEGRFVHELVVPFVRTGSPAAVPRMDAPARVKAPRDSVRSFPPGSEWLFVKLYTGTATVDYVLQEVVGPVVRDAMASGAADRWFFIRYGDPEWHLRLRMHGSPAALHGHVLPALQSAAAHALRDGRLWRIDLSTYEREIERYGGDEGIGLAEELFHADSEAALAIGSMLGGEAALDARWRLALAGMDQLLTDLGLDLAAKRQVMAQCRESFGREFRVNVAFERQLGERFRKHRAGLEALIDLSKQGESEFAPALAVLHSRSERVCAIVERLRAREQAGQLSMSIASLAPSYLHMHANRLLRSGARAQELILYDFLARLYESQAARARARSKSL